MWYNAFNSAFDNKRSMRRKVTRGVDSMSNLGGKAISFTKLEFGFK